LFGLAYGMHAARFAAQRIHFRHAIQEAFRSWLAGLPIER
jgi:hypothetical protein